MATKLTKLDADVVIVGAGPGGCTLARELSKMGKKVIITERGGWVKRLGNPLTLAKTMEDRGRVTTVEGYPLMFCMGVGGGSLVYVGAVGQPNHQMWAKYGIDITQETEEARKECWVQEVPEAFVHPGAKRLWTAAQELGYPFHLLEKFVDISKCPEGCSKCIMGCPKGAKWTAVEFANEAIANGTTLLPNVTITEIIRENGTAVGVKGQGKNGQMYEIHGKTIVLAAGGVGTARLMQAAGIKEAGDSFVGDPSISSRGYLKEGRGQLGDFGMSVGFHDYENGIMYCNTYPSRMFFFAALMGSKAPFKYKWQGLKKFVKRYHKGMGIFAKVTDDLDGKILENGVSKKWTERDQKRLKLGLETNAKILIQAGCDPNSIEHSPPTMSHPGATVRIGHLLDSNLATSIPNLYCCDSSVFPEAPGMPPALSVIALSKRLAKHLGGAPEPRTTEKKA